MEQLPLWHRSRPPVEGQDYWHPKYSAVVRAVRGGRECRRLCSARVERPHGGVASHRQHQLGALKRQLDTLDELQGARAITTLRGGALSTTEEAQRSSARTEAERLYARLVDSKYDAIEREQRGPERCGKYTPTLDQPECARCRAGLPARRARASADEVRVQRALDAEVAAATAPVFAAAPAVDDDGRTGVDADGCADAVCTGVQALLATEPDLQMAPARASDAHPKKRYIVARDGRAPRVCVRARQCEAGEVPRFVYRLACDADADVGESAARELGDAGAAKCTEKAVRKWIDGRAFCRRHLRACTVNADALAMRQARSKRQRTERG